MGVLTEKPVKIVEKLEDTLGTILKDVINIYKIDHRYKVYKREKEIAVFKIKPMPGQCGVAVIYELNCFLDQDIGTPMLEHALKICKEQDYTSVQVTLLKDSQELFNLLTEKGFELCYQFRNVRTKNAVLVMQTFVNKIK